MVRKYDGSHPELNCVWIYIHCCPYGWNSFVFRQIPLFIPIMKVNCGLIFTVIGLEETDQ